MIQQNKILLSSKQLTSLNTCMRKGKQKWTSCFTCFNLLFSLRGKKVLKDVFYCWCFGLYLYLTHSKTNERQLRKKHTVQDQKKKIEEISLGRRKNGQESFEVRMRGTEGGLYAKHKLSYSTFLNQEGCTVGYELYSSQNKRGKLKNSLSYFHSNAQLCQKRQVHGLNS